MFKFLDEYSTWVMRMELADEKHISPVLYRDIMRNVEDSFNLDYNMLIEGFNFY